MRAAEEPQMLYTVLRAVRGSILRFSTLSAPSRSMSVTGHTSPSMLRTRRRICSTHGRIQAPSFCLRQLMDLPIGCSWPAFPGTRFRRLALLPDSGDPATWRPIGLYRATQEQGRRYREENA